MWRGNRGLASPALVVGLMLTAAIPSTVAPATDGGQPQDAPQLLELFGAPSIPADYTLVVDTSSSMRDADPPASKEAKKGIARFAKAVPTGDRVTLIYFDEAPRTVYSKRIKSKKDRTDLAKQGASEKFNGQATDIGAALGDAQKRMSSPRASAVEVQTLLFISDGANNPPPGSPYSVRPTNKAWDALGETGDALADSHVLNVTGIGVGTTAGVDLLRAAFPADVITILDLPSDQLAGVFSDVIAQTQLNKIRTEVSSDLASGVSAEVDIPRLKEGGEATLTLTNTREKLDTTVTLDAVALRVEGGDEIPVEVDPASTQPVTLRPGESVDYPLILHPEGAVDTSIALGQPSVVEPVAAEVAVTLGTPSAPLLKRLYVNDKLDPESLGRSSTLATVDEDVVVRTGVPLWVLGLAALLAALFVWLLVWLYRLWRVPPKLMDVLSYRDAEGKAALIQLRGKVMPVPSADVHVPMAGRSGVTFFTKPGPKNRHKVFVRREAAPVKLFDQFGSTPNGLDVTEGGIEMAIWDEITIGDSPRLQLLPKGQSVS